MATCHPLQGLGVGEGPGLRAPLIPHPSRTRVLVWGGLGGKSFLESSTVCSSELCQPQHAKIPGALVPMSVRWGRVAQGPCLSHVPLGDRPCGVVAVHPGASTLHTAHLALSLWGPHIAEFPVPPPEETESWPGPQGCVQLRSSPTRLMLLQEEGQCRLRTLVESAAGALRAAESSEQPCSPATPHPAEHTPALSVPACAHGAPKGCQGSSGP